MCGGRTLYHGANSTRYTGSFSDDVGQVSPDSTSMCEGDLFKFLLLLSLLLFIGRSTTTWDGIGTTTTLLRSVRPF